MKYPIRLIISITLLLLVFPQCDFLVVKSYSKSEETSINEFTQMMKYISLEKSLVIESNLSKSEKMIALDALQNLKREYKLYLRNLSKYRREELMNFGYTNAQIEAIVNFDGSDQMAQIASAILSATTNWILYYYNSSSNFTYVTIETDGLWNGIPFNQYTDTVTMTAVGSSANYLNQGQSGFLTYRSISQTKECEYALSSSSFVIVPGAGFHVKVPMSKIITECYGNTTLYKYHITYTGIAEGKVRLSEGGAAYAHKMANWYWSPSIGFTLKGAGSVSLTVSLDFTEIYRDITLHNIP